MGISIQPVEESDLPTCGQLLTAYKMSTTINRLLWKVWPNDKLQQEQTLGAVTQSYNNKASQMLKAVDNNTGEVVGCLIITRQTAVSAPASALDSSAAAAPEVPDRFNADVFLAVIKAMGDIGKETEHLNHLDISAFTIRQGHYGKGIGSELMKTAFDRARAENIPIVVRAEPADFTFYDGHGFRETKVVDLELAKWATPMSGYDVYRLKGMIWHP